MPNIITHYLFAKKCFENTNEQVKKCIEKYPREYVIGSNGPDFLFFYQFFDSKKEWVRNIGNLLHSSKINEFYTLAIQEIEKCEDEAEKEAMIAYLAGHLCHWALDSRSHPYVFYRTGNYSDIHASMHHRLEYMIDAMLLQRIKNKDIRQFKYYLLAKQSSISAKIVAKIYVPICNQLFNCNLTDKIIKEALDDWYHLNKLTYDPAGIKTSLVKIYEKMIKKPWLFTGNIIPVKIDDKYDVLNLEKKQWCYPTDAAITSHESFLEIFDRAVVLANQCLDVMLDREKLGTYLNEESYDTGSRSHDMKYFEMIYDDVKYEEEE